MKKKKVQPAKKKTAKAGKTSMVDDKNLIIIGGVCFIMLVLIILPMIF